MERLLLYLDDIEDAIFAVALAGERIRRLLRVLGLLGLTVGTQVFAVLVAARDPALGAGIAALLAVVVLYRSAVATSEPQAQYA